MAHDLTTFDRHYAGHVVLTAVPAGVDVKTFDYHFEGMAVASGEAVVTGFVPYPHVAGMTGGIAI